MLDAGDSPAYFINYKEHNRLEEALVKIKNEKEVGGNVNYRKNL